MTWDQLAIDLLKAARAMRETHPRSSASRSYYSAHIALAKELESRGFVVKRPYSTQPHKGQSKLIDQYLGHLGPKAVKRLKRTMSRLYSRRIDSDYVRRVTIDRGLAMDSLRDASAVCVALKIKEAA